MLSETQELELAARRDTVASLVRARTWSAVMTLGLGAMSVAATVTIGFILWHR